MEISVEFQGTEGFSGIDFLIDKFHEKEWFDREERRTMMSKGGLSS